MLFTDSINFNLHVNISMNSFKTLIETLKTVFQWGFIGLKENIKCSFVFDIKTDL